MLSGLSVRLIEHGSDEYRQAVALRYRILREPLGLTFREEDLQAECNDYHIAAWLDGAMVGCLILTPVDGAIIRARQVAVDDGLQGKGIGKALMQKAEELAQSKGYRRMTLHARETAIPFYNRLNYTPEGRRFIEVGIPHQIMSRELWLKP